MKFKLFSMRERLLYLAILYEGKTYLIWDHLNKNKPIDSKKVDDAVKFMKKVKINWITNLDDNYPKELNQIQYPPYVIFYQGNINIIQNDNKQCVTGEIYDANILKNIIKYVNSHAKGATLVTSYSKYLDKNILNEFLFCNQKAVLVAPNGLNEPYFINTINHKNVLIISKVPPFSHISKRKIYERNQIISALSNFLVVFSSNKRSGIHKMVNCFLDLGKEIYVYPSLTKSDGNETLIEQGANVLQI